MPDLTIIIVTYNPGVILYDCLRSLPASVGDLSYEVLIVDNASHDGIIQQAVERFPGIQLITNADNRGFAGGNNQGLVKATGQFLLLLNPDVVLEPNSLAELVDFLKQNPKIGIVGPRTLDGKGVLSLTANAPYHAGTILWQYGGLDRLFPHHVYGRYRAASATCDQPFEVAWVQACCLMTRREVYERIGGLDEGLFLFAEDPDFCDRAAQAGWKTYFLPTACITHYESTVVSRYPERRIRYYHMSPLYYFRKRKREMQVVLLKIGFTIELSMKLTLALMAGLFKSNIRSRIPIYRKVLKEVWEY